MLSKILFFIYLLAVRGLLSAFSSCGEHGLVLLVVHRLLIAAAPLVAKHRLQGTVAAPGLRCPVACGAFPDEGLSPCPLN